MWPSTSTCPRTAYSTPIRTSPTAFIGSSVQEEALEITRRDRKEEQQEEENLEKLLEFKEKKLD